MLPWILCGVLSAVVIMLVIKLVLIRKSINEICKELSDLISMDTNRRLTVSSSDKYIRRLAAELSAELQELKKAERRYKDGDRELKEAITNISHDLRTPLTAASGYIELLREEEMSGDAKRYTGVVKERITALNELVEELFRYSVITSKAELKMEKTDVRAVLQDCLVGFYGTFKSAGIEPVIIIPEKSVIRETDATALKRVFDNIIGNAVKYSDGDLSVTMTEDGEITFSNKSAALSPVLVARLFDKFFTLDTARASTGLGLSIAKHLTEQMNGTISAAYNNGSVYITVKY